MHMLLCSFKEDYTIDDKGVVSTETCIDRFKVHTVITQTCIDSVKVHNV